MMVDMPVLGEAKRRLSGEYLLSFCASPRYDPPLDPGNLRHELDRLAFLTEDAARWFLAAFDDRVVEMRHGYAVLPDGRSCQLYGADRGVPYFANESVLAVAAAARLVLDYGWSPEMLEFESPRSGPVALAFDCVGYRDRREGLVELAVEVKWKSSDVAKLLSELAVCCAYGKHTLAECGQSFAHKKWAGLQALRPATLWIVGPDSFGRDVADVFEVAHTSDGVTELEPASSASLRLASD